MSISVNTGGKDSWTLAWRSQAESFIFMCWVQKYFSLFPMWKFISRYSSSTAFLTGHHPGHLQTFTLPSALLHSCLCLLAGHSGLLQFIQKVDLSVCLMTVLLHPMIGFSLVCSRPSDLGHSIRSLLVVIQCCPLFWYSSKWVILRTCSLWLL